MCMENSMKYYEVRQMESLKDLINQNANLYGGNTAFLVKDEKGETTGTLPINNSKRISMLWGQNFWAWDLRIQK